jgi:hypothetical protein
VKNVLHAPTVLCNIIGQGIHQDYRVSIHPSDNLSASTITDNHGRAAGYFKPFAEQGVRFIELRLSDPPVGPELGPSPFDRNVRYMIHAVWSDTERQRFAARQELQTRLVADASSLTSAEKAWLQEHFESEFKFLCAYELSIYNEEDREEGRRILRALMSDDDN